MAVKGAAACKILRGVLYLKGKRYLLHMVKVTVEEDTILIATAYKKTKCHTAKKYAHKPQRAVIAAERGMTAAFQKSVNSAIKNSRSMGAPIARYDVETRRPYLEYADGRREYVR